MSFWRGDYRGLSLALSSAPLGFDQPGPDWSGMKVSCLNKRLLEEWGMVSQIVDEGDVERWMKQAPHPFAMAYAGHQYGHFTMLGDGRALLVGEWQNASNQCYDIHLKGSGPTPFARRGDGQATLRSMLREFLISEALHGLGVPTTRSLMVLETPHKVWRDYDQRGGVLVRVAPHHVRIGTLEYAIRALNPDDYALYAGAVLQRTTQCWAKEPSLGPEKSLYTPSSWRPEAVVAFFEDWSLRQAELLAHWMRVGFVHGVLNTDNISLLGVTMDLGPCAFVNAYDLNRSFSSIDTQGRYAWGHQVEVMEWNASVLLSCLLPLLADDGNTTNAMPVARGLLDQFRTQCQEAQTRMHFRKLGLDPAKGHGDDRVLALVEEWQSWLSVQQPDYALVYLELEKILAETLEGGPSKDSGSSLDFDSIFNANPQSLPSGAWLSGWLRVLGESEGGDSAALHRMQENNPSLIPRNHWVEQALDQRVLHGSTGLWDELRTAMENPYQRHDRYKHLNQPPQHGDAGYQTFCGT